MQESEMSNAICFLTRDYGGIHLGFRRYEIISELLDDIYEKVTDKKEAPSTLMIYKQKEKIPAKNNVYNVRVRYKMYKRVKTGGKKICYYHE
jgi:hypothetical protein